MSGDYSGGIIEPKLQQDKQFVRTHRIRKQEQKIITLVNVYFSCTTPEAKAETLRLLDEANTVLDELEHDA